MSNLRVTLVEEQVAGARDRPLVFGRDLIERGVIAPWQLFHALKQGAEWDATLSEILMSRGWIDECQKLGSLSQQSVLPSADLTAVPPDEGIAHILSPEFCLRHNVMPWRTLNGVHVLATGRPDRAAQLRNILPEALRDAMLVAAPTDQITHAIETCHRKALTLGAEGRVPAGLSCRSWRRPTASRSAGFVALVVGLIFVFSLFPAVAVMALSMVAISGMLVMSTLKFMAFIAYLTRPAARPQQPYLPPPAHPPQGVLPHATHLMPRISVLVPLFDEHEIAQALIARLSLLTYPKALLEVLLVLEEHDSVTRRTINRTRLPHWMRVVSVPAGPNGLTTKPRALNYALDHCRGEIVGIWDAEDAPAPNQLEQIAQRFAAAPPDVACLQGVLDYYNPFTNWLSRCFTLEYASWFRVILPGCARLGLAIPLGGTTLYLRRDAIERVGRWDAHNVTEDADLGIRLARFGLRTEMVATATHEEACCRFWPWIRQRSRWLKGYMITYLVHMRHPVRLWRDLGPRRFFGFQVMFGCAPLQFVLAPALWVFLLESLGMPNPLNDVVTSPVKLTILAVLILAALLDAAIAVTAIRGTGRAWLLPWIAAMGIYFTLASLGAFKALVELATNPCYWDKTQHGTTAEGRAEGDTAGIPRRESRRGVVAAFASAPRILFQTGDKGL